MICLISPTKTQKHAASLFYQEPEFHQQSMDIHNTISSWSLEEILVNYKVSEKLANSIYKTNNKFEEDNRALFTYQGSSFKNMERDNWNEDDIKYAEDHLRILSAMYGILKPNDSIGLYRLDFLTKFHTNLYNLWQPTITQYLNKLKMPIINLASQEYSEMVDVSQLKVPFITISFKEIVNGKAIVKSTYAKVARGVMVKEIIQNRVDTLEELKKVSVLDYTFDSNRSTDTHFIYSR